MKKQLQYQHHIQPVYLVVMAFTSDQPYEIT